MIPSSRPGKVIFAHDDVAYEHRKRITRCFGRMKHVRAFRNPLRTQDRSV